MVFTKAGVPSAGKYRALKWNGTEYQKLEKQNGKSAKTRFIDQEEDDPSLEEETRVLKPCVYKPR